MRNHGTGPVAALRGHARARAGHARDLGPRTEASFHGELVDFDRMLVVAQAGCRIGCRCGSRRRPGRRCSTEVLEYGDGSFPSISNLDELATRVAELQRDAPPTPAASAVPITSFGLRDPDDDELEKMNAAGVDRVLLHAPARRRRRDPSARRALRRLRGAPPLMDEARCRARLSAARGSGRLGQPVRPRVDGRPARRRLLLCAAGQPPVEDSHRRQARDDHPVAAPGQRPAPTHGRACSSTTTRRMGRAVVGSAPDGPRYANRGCFRFTNKGAGREVRAVRGGASAGIFSPVAVERWRSGWSARNSVVCCAWVAVCGAKLPYARGRGLNGGRGAGGHPGALALIVGGQKREFLPHTRQKGAPVTDRDACRACRAYPDKPDTRRAGEQGKRARRAPPIAAAFSLDDAVRAAQGPSARGTTARLPPAEHDRIAPDPLTHEGSDSAAATATVVSRDGEWAQPARAAADSDVLPAARARGRRSSRRRGRPCHGARGGAGGRPCRSAEASARRAERSRTAERSASRSMWKRSSGAPRPRSAGEPAPEARGTARRRAGT